MRRIDRCPVDRPAAKRSARFLLLRRRAMTPEYVAALLPVLGTWMMAGLVTGWVFELLSAARARR